MSAALPSLYLSHGSPMIALEPGPAGRWMQQLGRAIERRFGRPRAVLVVSPHTPTRTPLLLAAERHEAVHDFSGFPEALYDLRYDAEGAPDVARRAVSLLQAAEIPAIAVPEGGMDHGIWTVLRHVWPQAEVPVLPMSLVPTWAADRQWQVGQALAPLRQEGVLVVGSGSLTHNLRRAFSRMRGREEALPDADALAFQQWVQQRVQDGDWAALRDWRAQSPTPSNAHPTDEHWLPFFVAAGAAAGEAGNVGRRVHASLDLGLLAMDAYAFGDPEAVAALAEENLAPRTELAA